MQAIKTASVIMGVTMCIILWQLFTQWQAGNTYTSVILIGLLGLNLGVFMITWAVAKITYRCERLATDCNQTIQNVEAVVAEIQKVIDSE